MKITGNIGKWDKLTKPRETREHRKNSMGITNIGVLRHRLKKKCETIFCKQNVI